MQLATIENYLLIEHEACQRMESTHMGNCKLFGSRDDVNEQGARGQKRARERENGAQPGSKCCTFLGWVVGERDF
jgi:hypothetical protein